MAKTLIDHSQHAFKSFEQFVTERAGDRQAFNSMAGGGRNDGQATTLTHKKAAFRAGAHFLGVETDTVAITFLLHRSVRNPGKCDLATLVYKIGIRRLRPEARVLLAYVRKSWDEVTSDDLDSRRFEPIEPDVDPHFIATLLPPFCSNAKADTVVTMVDRDHVQMEIAAGSIDTTGATNWAFGVEERNSAVEMESGRNLKLHANISAAAKTLVVDVMIEPVVTAEPSTKVLTYLHSNTIVDGQLIRAEHERMNISESVVAMGRGDSAAQRSELPRYAELIDYACERLGWSAKDFKTYRCRVEYPVLGSGLDLHFDYPSEK